MRRHLTYANVAATLALFFGMSGGAIAASHYLITSTKQIKPSVLKKLKGNAGPAGPPGAAGVPGTAGAPGKTGATGEIGPSHAYTESHSGIDGTASVTVPAGDYVVIGEGQFFDDSPEPGSGTCVLSGPTGRLDMKFAVIPNRGEVDEFTKEGSNTIPTQGTVQLTSSGTLTVTCEEGRESAEPVKLGLAEITAIQVGGITTDE